MSAASRFVSMLLEFSCVQSDKHRDDSRCGSLKAAPRFHEKYVGLRTSAGATKFQGVVNLDVAYIFIDNFSVVVQLLS